MLFIDWLAKVSEDPVFQGSGSVNIIWKGRHQDCWNRVARIHEASIEFNPGHRRHVDVGD